MRMLISFGAVIAMIGISVHFTKGEDVVFDNSKGYGRKFDGIGGLSGGGATSKLLVNYPEKQRNEILDYLFKPNFGASLQILKVEIGGDIQSTDGTEASHMHNSWEENYFRGYEWWLMKEAKLRNPDIILYGLPWGFPGWIGQGTRSPYANVSVTADYIVRWISGAKKFHNLHINYIGIWNERPYNIPYIKELRKVLDERGFTSTAIIAADVKWNIAKDVLSDSALAGDVYGLGCHYPGTLSTADAVKTGKPLWSSEDYSTKNDEVGGGCWARILNQNYVNGMMSATISWNLIASYYPNLPYYRDGLMTAVQPWSGNYQVDTPIWVSAHTTQFTEIGWKYLRHGSGVGKLSKGGSYVSLVNKHEDELTIVIETMTHDHSICIRPPLPKYTVEPQVVNIYVKGGFAQASEMNVWYSKFYFNGSSSVMFKRSTPLKFKNGKATLSLGLDEIYTLTTLNVGQKGSFPTPPSPAQFPAQPYKDDFETYKEFQEPNNITPQIGSLEVVKSQNASHGLVMRQTVLQPPILWCPIALSFPYAVIGNDSWTAFDIQIDYSIPSVNGSTGVFVAARADVGGCDSFAAHGLFFFVLESQFILANDLARTKVIKQGALSSAIAPNSWHRLQLVVSKNGTTTGAFDGQTLFQVQTPEKPANGFAALGTDSFGLADFDNLVLVAS